MLKTKFRRFAALLAVVALLTSAIGLAIGGTGAYFTDSHSGQIGGNNGTIAISVSGSGGTSAGDPSLVTFDFSGILPGAPGKTATVNVTNLTANDEAIWLVFSNANGMWSGVNNLGQYGKFTVGGYVYDNLQNKNTNAEPATPGVAGAPIAGQFMGQDCTTVNRVPINYLPHAIKIATLGASGNVSFPISFEYIACMTAHQGESLFNALGNDIGGTGGAALAAAPSVPLMFNVVAFQAGVDPTSPFNGAAAIAPLNLSTYNLSTHQYIQP